MRIAHISDIHQGLHYAGPSPSSRFDDINRILDWTADRLIAEKVDLCLIAGDCFKDAKVMLDRASQEIASIVRFLRQLSSAGIETIVISGTPSHDALSAYGLIKEMGIKGVQIFTAPKVCYADVPKEEYRNFFPVALLPGLNRSALLTQEEYKGLPPEQVHRIMTDKISQLCMGMAAQMPDDKPKILMAHMTYQGADTGFTDLLMQHEPILTREAVAGFDLVCLGHIHRPQVIDGKVFYSGPVERLSFNEQDIIPGFWIHDLSENVSNFIATPARRYVTVNWDEETVRWYLADDEAGPLFLNSQGKIDNFQDAIVRLRYSCSEEVAKQLNRKQLEQSLYDAGCFYVAEIKAEIERTDRARDSEVTEALTPLLALEKWAINQNIDEAEIKELVSMASGLLEG